MSEETPPEPKPRRRRKKAASAQTPSPAEGPRPDSETGGEAAATRGPSDRDDAPAPPVPGEGPEEPIVVEEPDAAIEHVAEVEPEAAKKPARRRRRGAVAEDLPAGPAPTRRRRAQRDPSLPPPVVRAQAKYVRSSARKARLVCDHIRGKSVEDARAILALTPRAIARDWSKLLESAVANAEHNHELVGEDLYVKAVHADEGPTIRRFRPRAMGRATKIRKRTSHLTILLTPKE
jgi:ribosomal protein L22